jgi:hypothetical protein
MRIRRSFLKGAATAGIAFCSGATLEAPRAQEPGRRLPVMVKASESGSRRSMCTRTACSKTPSNLMGDDARNVFVPVKGAENQYIVIAERLKQMDAMAIDMEVPSINRFGIARTATRRRQSSGCRPRSLQSCAPCNRKPSRALRRWPPQFSDMAVQQLEDAISRCTLDVLLDRSSLSRGCRIELFRNDVRARCHDASSTPNRAASRGIKEHCSVARAPLMTAIRRSHHHPYAHDHDQLPNVSLRS